MSLALFDGPDPSKSLTRRGIGVIACVAPWGAPYRLACDGVVSYRPSDDPDAIWVQMSRGAVAVLVHGTVAAMDKAFSDAAQSPADPCLTCLLRDGMEVF